MKKIVRRLKQKILVKDSPPPYSVNDNVNQLEILQESNNAPAYEVIDLLANCTISAEADDGEDSNVEYKEFAEMGIWHSTPLARRHKSKISLTWVLKENLETNKLSTEKRYVDTILNTTTYDVDRNQHQCKRSDENERQRKCKSREVRDRVAGRNEYYHNLRFKSACEEFVNGRDTYSDDTSGGTEEYERRKHRHRHRRKKDKQNSKFGYDIKDLDSFLCEATIDRPGNIPVVIAYPSTLYQTQNEKQQELALPLGTVVNAVFKNEQWLYAQTPHGEEGYVLYSACLPLGILPNKPLSQKKTPCWESSTDIYRRPCGNLTDNEKEQVLRGRTRSECRYQPRVKRKTSRCPERDFDTLYLKTKSVCSTINRIHEKEVEIKRQILLVVNSDFKGSVLNRTLSVQRGDVVVLVQGRGVETDVDADWFYVRKKDGTQGFIPAVVAGHGSNPGSIKQGIKLPVADSIATIMHMLTYDTVLSLNPLMEKKLNLKY